MTKMDSAHSGGHAADSSAGATPSVVSLGGILDRRVPLEWYESVAVVAGLCTAMVDSHSTGMPAPHDVVLSPEGTISINGPGAHEFSALPRLLHELLSVTTPPTPLRLLVLHMISSDGDKSPSAFGAALAYYERPGREMWIQAARQRCLETPVPNEVAERPSLSELFEIKKAAEPKKAVEPKKTAKPQRKRVVMATLAAGFAVVALALLASYRSGNTTVVNGVSMARAVAAHVTEAGRGFAKAFTAEWTGNAGGSTASTSTADATPQGNERSRPARRKHEAQDRETIDGGHLAGDVAPVVTSSGSSVDSETAAGALAELASAADSDTAEALVRPEIPIGVVPPRLLDPVRLPSWAQESTTESPNIIELDINDDGKVERVRLISPTTRLTDMMILSAAKTWIFEPASEGGHPVPYRMTLNWVPSAR